MKKLVIFDLDGTLLDTVADLQICINAVFEKYGYKTLSKQEMLPCMGYGARNLVRLASGEQDEKVLDKLFDEYMALLKDSDSALTFLYDGLDEVLTKLKSMNFLLAIVSNKPDIATQIVVEQKLKKYNFDFVTGTRPELFKTKPDKSCVEYCLNALGIKKEDAVYVGDSEVDAETYQNAGVDGISVTWGFRDYKTLEKAGAKTIVNTASEMLDAILKY